MKYLLSISHIYFLLSFNLLIITKLAQAQEQVIDKLATAMTDSLSYLQLTDQQISDVRGLNKNAATSLAEVTQKAKKDTSFKGKALTQQVMSIMNTRNEGLESMLTQDQKKIYEEHKAEQLAELQTKMMISQLNLNDQQIPQVYQINLESIREMLENVSDAKEATRKMEKVRTARSIKSDSKDKDKQLKKILSPDQFNKYEQSKEAQQAAIKEKMNEKKASQE